MKNSLTCPKCQSRRLWTVERMALPTPETANTVFPFPVVAQEVPRARSDNVDRVAGGTFSAWICAQCGYTEWYARDAAAALTKLAQTPNSGVRWIDTTPQRGPFR